MRILIILLLLVCITESPAQGYAPFIRNFGQRDYGKNLPPANNAVVQDQRGFIYAANTGVVLEYDGNDWRSIPVKTGDYVSALAVDQNGIVYVGSMNDIGFLSPDAQGKMSYHSLKALIPEEHNNFGLVLRCNVAQDAVYFQEEFKLFRYADGKIEVLPAPVSFHLSFSCDGKFLARERSLGLVTVENGELKTLSNDPLLVNNGIFAVEKWNEKEWVLGIRDQGLFLYDHQNNKLRHFGKDTLLMKQVQINDLCVLQSDDIRLAVSSSGQGVLLFNSSGQLIKTIKRSSGIQTDEIRDLHKDFKGNLWGVSPSGVHFMRINSPFEMFSARHGLEGEVESLCLFNGHVYAGTSSGLYAGNSSGRTIFENAGDVKGHVTEVRSFIDASGNELMLVSTSDGLYLKTLSETKKISRDIFNAAYFDAELNTILAVGKSGVYSYAYPSGMLIQIEKMSIARGLRIEKNHLLSNGETHQFWIGMVEEGVIKILMDRDGTFSAHVYTQADGLGHGSVRPFVYRDEVIFATGTGFQYFISEEEIRMGLDDSLKGNPDYERGMFDMYTLLDSVWRNPIGGIAIDKHNGAWLVADNAVLHINKNGTTDSLTFAEVDLGMINEIFAPGGQTLFIAGSNGLIKFNPDFQSPDVFSHPVMIREVFSSGGKFHFYGSYGDSLKIDAQQLPENYPQLAYSENALEFRFAFPTAESPQKAEYAWMLEGYEEKWSEWSPQNSVAYTNLHEGAYTFRVKARNQNGFHSEEAFFHFTILPPWYRTYWAYAAYFIFLALLIFIAIRIASYRLKQKNIQLENIVQQRTAEIAQKNNELEHQNEQILHQKQEITDSITYAKRIQEAILPIRNEIRRYFPQSMVLFKPKDIVSGDFYWFYHQKGKSILVCADCTGHGVPGAFMSMICTDKLNHAALEKDIFEPGLMLSEVNKGIKRSLKQENDENIQTKDGMDAAIFSFEHATSVLTYSGANRPLWLLRGGLIEEFKPTKCAIGGFTPEEQIFEQIEIPIQPGDQIYMSTDGYADQFGGEKGKKMMVKNFKEKIISVSRLSMDEQLQALQEHFESWKSHPDENGNPYEQVDDVCVLGVRF